MVRHRGFRVINAKSLQCIAASELKPVLSLIEQPVPMLMPNIKAVPFLFHVKLRIEPPSMDMAGSHGYRASTAPRCPESRRLGRPRFLLPLSLCNAPCRILCGPNIDSAGSAFRGFSSLLRSRCLQTFSITAQAGGML